MTRDWVWSLTSDLNPQSTRRSLLCWWKKNDALKITYDFGNCISVHRDYLNTHWENHATYAQWNTLKDWKRFLWPKSLVAKEMQIKMTIWYPSIPSRVTIITEQGEKGKTGNTKSCSYQGTVLIFLPKAQQSCQVNSQFRYWAYESIWAHESVHVCL